MKVVRQEGVDGCRVAHERKVWDGWAGEVMGASAVRGGGRVCVEGKRIGEMKGLEGAVSGIDSLVTRTVEGAYGQLSRDISASESTIVFVLGHERFGG